MHYFYGYLMFFNILKNSEREIQSVVYEKTMSFEIRNWFPLQISTVFLNDLEVPTMMSEVEVETTCDFQDTTNQEFCVKQESVADNGLLAFAITGIAYIGGGH